MWRVCWLAKELLASQEGPYSMKFSSQSVSWLPVIRYLVSFPCIYWRSLVLLYTQAQNTHHAFLHNANNFFQVSVLQFWNWLPAAAESSVSVTKWLTITRHSSRLLVTVSERKRTNHIHVIKYATLYTVTHTFLPSTNSQQSYNKMWTAMQTQNCLLQKSRKIQLNEISLTTALVYTWT